MAADTPDAPSEGTADGPPDGPPDGQGDDSAAVLGCEVTADHAGWWVELVVGFTDDVARRRIGPYLTEKHAKVAAHHIRRAADRDAPPPTGW